jgi:hypothetical protein
MVIDRHVRRREGSVLIPSIRTEVRILPMCHDYVDGSLDEIEAQSKGLKAGAFSLRPLRSREVNNDMQTGSGISLMKVWRIIP